METYVCSLQTQTGLEQRQNLVEVSTTFVQLHKCWELLRVYDDIKTANLC